MNTQTTTSGATPHTDTPETAQRFRASSSGARALVTVLALVAFVGLTLILGFVLDIFLGPDPQGSMDAVIVGGVILVVSGAPLLVLLFLPWWQRSVATALRADGRERALRILWWSAGACGLGMLYAMRYLARNPGDWHDVVDEEITLLPLLLLILAAWLALAAGVGWAKVLARVVFIGFSIPWILYNPFGSILGLGIMFFGLRSLRAVQPEFESRLSRNQDRWSSDRAYWWDGNGWRTTSPDRHQYWDGLTWRSIDGSALAGPRQP